jgi:hypothetical protein
MILIKIKNFDYIVYILLFICLLTILIPTCPYIQKEPGRDSGVFLYAGQQILNGNLPYRDFWDHKPPLIFYINSIGLILGANTTWGIWLLEMLFLYSATILSFKLLNEAFDKKLSLIITFLWIFTLTFVMEGGNLTTEYAIPIQFAILYLFFISQKKLDHVNQSHIYEYFIFFIIGNLSILLILLKPNLFSIPLSIFIVLLLSYFLQNKDLKNNIIKKSLSLIFGAFLPLFLIYIYFLINGIFSDFYDAVIVYNLLYSSDSSIMLKFYSLYNGINLLFPIFIIAFAGFLLFLFNLIFKKINSNKIFYLLMVASISFPLELLLTAYSGRGYGHYFMSWLPILAVLAAYFLFSLIKSLKIIFLTFTLDIEQFSKQLIILSFILSLFFVPFSYSIAQNIYAFKKNNQNTEVIDFINTNTKNTNYVFLWGAETKYNFLTNRKSPTKYNYIYPLLTKNYGNADKIQEFIIELQKNNPVLIIDTSASNSLIPPLNYSKRIEWKENSNNIYDEKFEIFFKYFEENFELVTVTKDSKWEIYRIKNTTVF